MPCSLPVEGRPQGTCGVQSGHLHPGYGQIARVKMALITPSATIQLTSPSGIFLPGKAVPRVATSHFAASHSWCEKERDENSIVGRKKLDVPWDNTGTLPGALFSFLFSCGSTSDSMSCPLLFKGRELNGVPPLWCLPAIVRNRTV